MTIRHITALALLSLPLTCTAVEKLDRGLVVIRSDTNAVYLSWRLLTGVSLSSPAAAVL